MLKAQCKRLATRSVVYGKTVFKFDKDGICEVPPIAQYDFDILIQQNGISVYNPPEAAVAAPATPLDSTPAPAPTPAPPVVEEPEAPPASVVKDDSDEDDDDEEPTDPGTPKAKAVTVTETPKRRTGRRKSTKKDK